MRLWLLLIMSTAPIFGSITCDRSGVTEASQFTDRYDALEPAGRRKSPPATKATVDATLTDSRRIKLAANTLDLTRNFAIAQWMIRKHLDYVSSFDFDADTGDEGFDRDWEFLMAQANHRQAADVSARFTREKLFRLAELLRVVGGDCGLLLLNDGRMQGFESDLIRNPDKIKRTSDAGPQWVNGVLVERRGSRPLRYALHARGRGGRGYNFQREVRAANFLHYGFFQRFTSEQTRGVSPLVSALTPLRDVYEGFDYALARAKVSQLFALAFYRTAEESPGDVENDNPDDDKEDKSGYQVDFGKGPALLDLEAGDRAEFLESKQPSAEFQNFSEIMIAVALKSLDIPFSFFSENFSTFFGSRGAWLHYERSCEDKRDDQKELRRDYTIWRTRHFIIDGELTLPRGKTLGELSFEWVPRGVPWWDPAKEIRGDTMAVGAGFNNPFRVCKQRGTGSFKRNVDKIIEAIKYARDAGQAELGEPLVLSFDAGPAPLEIETSKE